MPLFQYLFQYTLYISLISRYMINNNYNIYMYITKNNTQRILTPSVPSFGRVVGVFRLLYVLFTIELLSLSQQHSCVTVFPCRYQRHNLIQEWLSLSLLWWVGNQNSCDIHLGQWLRSPIKFQALCCLEASRSNDC